MPSKKSRRVASRQAQLSGRSRRNRSRGPATVPSKRAKDAEPHTEAASSAEQAWIQGDTAPSAHTTQPAASAQAPRRSSRTRTRGAAVMPAETYFRAELMRIGVFLALILIILGGLTIVLR